jgi:hypothetical protein
MKNLKKWILAYTVILLAATPVLSSGDGFPRVLTQKERYETVDAVTRLRLDTLLPRMMDETNIDMWVMLCNEDNVDPVYKTMIPYRVWTEITQILVLYKPGPGKEVERLNISRTKMNGLHKDTWDYRAYTQGEGEDQWSCLGRIVKERDPKRIGINTSDVIWAADGLSVSMKEKLCETIGEKYSARLVSAEPLSVLWLETLIDEEIELFERAVAISHALIAETFSSKAIVPNYTTLDDLKWHYIQGAADLGCDVEATSFSFIRSPQDKEKYGKDDKVIRPGDLIRCDVCLIYLRYHTDHHQWGYVLRQGETDVPESFKKIMAEGNRLQDVYIGEFKAGLTGNQILKNVLQTAEAKGIMNPKIYSHALGYFLHEPGPLIGLPWEQVNTGPRGEVKLVPNSGFVAELSVACPVPEWNGEMLRFALEEDLVYTKNGVVFLDGRQTKFHLVR